MSDQSGEKSTEVLGTLIANIEKRKCRISRDRRVIWDPFDDTSIQVDMKPLIGPNTGCQFVNENGTWYGILTVNQTIPTEAGVDVDAGKLLIENETLRHQNTELRAENITLKERAGGLESRLDNIRAGTDGFQTELEVDGTGEQMEEVEGDTISSAGNGESVVRLGGAPITGGAAAPGNPTPPEQEKAEVGQNQEPTSMPSEAVIRRMNKTMLIDLADVTGTEVAEDATNAAMADAIVDKMKESVA